jgi:hypothetical protein
MINLSSSLLRDKPLICTKRKQYTASNVKQNICTGTCKVMKLRVRIKHSNSGWESKNTNGNVLKLFFLPNMEIIEGRDKN